MEYLRSTLHIFTRNIFKKEKQEEAMEFSRVDAYMNYVHKILVWEDPMVSWTVLGVLHFLFWLIVYLEMRLYGVLFVTILIAFTIDTYFEHCGLKAQRTPSSDAVREVINIFTSTILYLQSLRKDNASLFCGIMCVVFLGLSFIARNVNGYLLTYLFSLAVFFGPLTFSKLPPQYVAYIKNTLRTISTNEGMLAEKELLPFLTEKERNEDAESFVSEKTAGGESVTNSLISGISAMPSYLDAEGSLDGLEEEDLDLPQKQALASAISEYSSDSDSEHKNIEFDSAHFNRDSSSEDENGYTKGLMFSDSKDVADSSNVFQASIAQSIGAGLISNLTNVGTNILTNVLKTVNAPSTTAAERSSSSESEFEIIDSEDLNEEDS